MFYSHDEAIREHELGVGSISCIFRVKQEVKRQASHTADTELAIRTQKPYTSTYVSKSYCLYTHGQAHRVRLTDALKRMYDCK